MAITYSIDGGADAAKFNINSTSGALTFKAAPDFEQPGDANGDNVYEVSVKATDAGGLSTSKLVKVTVTDVSEGAPPQITSAGAVTVKENSTTVMTVTATDPDDTTPPPVGTTGTIPLSYNDARFSGNAASSPVTLSTGQSIANKSITSIGGDSSIHCNGNNTVTNCRVNSREALRVGGNGMFEVIDCYLQADGQGDDHADVIQAYSPGARGTIKVRNSSIVLGFTAVNCGLFVADNWTGTIDLENVMFTGGNYGLRCHPDTGGDNIIRCKNVYFVAPFRYAPYMFSGYGGKRNIFELWENVCDATIVNGQLVPGAQIPKPA